MHKWLLVALLAAAPALAQDFSKVEIKFTHVAGTVYMLQGAGGNIGVSVGDDGIVVVDDEYAALAPKAHQVHHQHALPRRSHGRQRGVRAQRNDHRAGKRARIKAGKTLGQMKQEKILAPWDTWDSKAIPADRFIEVLYNDLSRTK